MIYSTCVFIDKQMVFAQISIAGCLTGGYTRDVIIAVWAIWLGSWHESTELLTCETCFKCFDFSNIFNKNS